MALNSTLSQTLTSLLSSVGPSSERALSTSSTSPSERVLSTSATSSSVRDSASSIISASSSSTTSSVKSTMSSSPAASTQSPAQTSTRRPSGDDPNPPSSTDNSVSSPTTSTSKPPPPPSSSSHPPPPPATTSSKQPSPPPSTPNSPLPAPPQQKPNTPNQPPATTQAPPSNNQVKPASSVTSKAPASSSSVTSRSGNSSTSIVRNSSAVPAADSTTISNVSVRPNVASGILQPSSILVPGGSATPSHSVSTSFATVHHSDFFSQGGKVAGVFVAVGITVLAILALLPCLLARHRRRRNHARPTPSRNPSMTSYADLHYRRASQIQAFGNTVYAGAGRPNSAGGSDDSHVVSSETHHSSEPIVTRGLHSFKSPASRALNTPYPEMRRTPLTPVPELPVFSNSLYPDVVNAALHRGDAGPPLIFTPTQMNYSRPKPTNPQLRNLKVDLGYLQPPQPIADPATSHSSPSLYPPTLPSDDDKATEERYWQQQGFERVESAQPSKQLPSPPDSALGLKFGPHSTVSQTSDDESELVGSLHPHMEPAIGSTAPIMPLRYRVSIE